MSLETVIINGYFDHKFLLPGHTFSHMIKIVEEHVKNFLELWEFQQCCYVFHETYIMGVSLVRS